MRNSTYAFQVVITVCLCLQPLAAQQGLSQDKSDKKPEFLQDVKHGMPMEDVIAGLRKHYDLKEEDDSGEGWMVTGKDQGAAERGEIIAVNGHVEIVTEDLLPDSLTGDSTIFIRALIRQLSIHSQPVSGDSVGNKRQGFATLELDEYHLKRQDWQRIGLWMGNEHYTIDLFTPDNSPPYVKFSRMW